MTFNELIFVFNGGVITGMIITYLVIYLTQKNKEVKK